MAKSLGSFRILLKLLTKTFLLEDDMTPFGSESVQRLIESQVKSFSDLANSLEEAQLEYPAIDIKKYEQCVKSISTLAQYLNGLRSSCGLQYDMLKKDEQRNPQAPGSQSSTLSGARGHGIGMRMSSFSLIGSLGSDQDQSASADLIEFLDHVGKPMKSLALTCKLTIEHLQEIFSNSDSEHRELVRRKSSKNRRSQQAQRQSEYESGDMFSDATAEAGSGSDSRKCPSLVLMQLNLAKALDIFEAANSKALKRFYSHQSKRRSGYFIRPLGSKKHMSAPSLQDLSARTGMNSEPGENTDPGLRPSSTRMNNQSQGSGQSPSEPPPASGTTGASRWRRGRKPRLFPEPNIHNTKNTLHTPAPSTFLQKWSTRLWKFLHVFRSFQVKYAAKTAISTMVLLIPAFVDWTRPYFVQYRGEWAIISMLIVMVPTVGGTNIVGLYRILGTVIGCYFGVAVYVLFPADDILLPICCFLFAVPNFYLVLCSNYPRIGQVTLLAFNLVLLQTYNRRNGDGSVPPDDDDDDDDISGNPFSARRVLHSTSSIMADPLPGNPGSVSDVWTIAFHRAVAVSLGVVVGVAVTSYVWPYEARVELRKGLSDLLLNISWLYNRLVSVYSTNLDRVSVVPSQERYQQSRSRFQALLRKTTFQERFQNPEVEINRTINGEGEMDIEMMNKEFMAIELSLQLQLLQLYALLEETPNEPRLKGKFPVTTYKNMLGSCQNILDRFLSMRLVITKDQWLESARRDFIVPVNKERREMVGNVLLYFYTIASALRLKTPLPPYLPPANNARLRLIRKIRQLPVVQNKVVMTEDNDERYIFYYAYALVMDDVIRELERLGQWSQDLFGPQNSNPGLLMMGMHHSHHRQPNCRLLPLEQYRFHLSETLTNRIGTQSRTLSLFLSLEASISHSLLVPNICIVTTPAPANLLVNQLACLCPQILDTELNSRKMVMIDCSHMNHKIPSVTQGRFRVGLRRNLRALKADEEKARRVSTRLLREAKVETPRTRQVDPAVAPRSWIWSFEKVKSGSTERISSINLFGFWTTCPTIDNVRACIETESTGSAFDGLFGGVCKRKSSNLAQVRVRYGCR
ncbi:hypothetical protein BGZ93_005475 [Podila epicladia]|nr:hypothetical protein BGZ93_005475 [Podila epicladia]